MIRTGKCPHCGKFISNVVYEPIEIHEGLQARYHGLSLLCPLCRKILHVDVDPFTMKEDIATAVQQKLKKG